MKNYLRKTNKLKVLSLFAGCGGLDLGFTGGFKFLNKDYPKRRFKLIWANKIEKDFCKTYRENFKHDIVEADIREILANHPASQSQPLPQHADIVLGGFPCQDFSHAGKRRGFGNENGRGLLYKSMVEVISRTRPLVFVAENVKGLLT